MLVLAWLLSTVISFSTSQDYLNILLEKEFNPSRLKFLAVYFPEKLNTWWTSIPPFVTQSLTSSENQTSGTIAASYQINGIFPDILKLAFNRCYAVQGKSKPVIIFKQLPVHNQSVLLEAIKRDEDFLLIPVQSDEKDKYKGFFTFLKLLESPGTVLIKREEDSITFRVQTWNTAILNCWPIITLTVSLSFVAGIAVWALEAKENSQEFRSPFCSGVFDGFWWAFVTMSTVGYGDKTPKSFISRLFSVIWIMTGITICSLLTATLSSAFTNEQVDYYGVLYGKKIGVVRNSIALQKAVSLGAKTEVFEDLDEVHKALVSKSVDGMLEEIYTAMEFLETTENSSLFVAHFYEEKRGFGLAGTPKFFDTLLWGCLKFVASIMKHNETVLMKHIHRFQIFKKGKDEISSKVTKETNKQNWPLFVKTVMCFSGIALVCLSFAVTRQCFRGCAMNRKRKDIKMGQQRKISAQTSPWSWYETKLPVAVKQFFKEASILWKKLRKANSNIVKPPLNNVNSK